MKPNSSLSSLFTVSVLSLVVAFFTPNVKAQEGYIVVERHSKRVLLASNSEKEVSTGSFSQLATAKIVLDWAKLSGTPLTTMMVVPHGVAESGLRNVLNIQTGDQLSMRDALYTMSLNQDSASALVLGDFVGRQVLARKGKGGSGYTAFIKEMNNLAGFLNMRSTSFKSPAGGVGKTKISDLAKLASYALKTNSYDFYMKQKTRLVNVHRAATGAKESFKITNSNSLLNTMSVGGLMVEGSNAVVSANKQNVVKKLADGRAQITPRQLVVVGFDAPNRDERMKQLIKSGWEIYEGWRQQGFPRTEKGKEFLK